jgi:Flp pilus assembly CpaE family ATPase
MEGAPKFVPKIDKEKLAEKAKKTKDIIGAVVGASIAAATPMHKAAVHSLEDMHKPIEVVRARDLDDGVANFELKENEKLVIQMPNEEQMKKVLESKKDEISTNNS